MMITSKFKESPVGLIPEDWSFTTIGQIASIVTGDKDTQDRDDSGIYPFFVRSQTVERISSFSFDGQAVLTAGDGVGVGKVFHYYIGKFNFHQRVYCIHSFIDDIDGYYFFLYFSQNFIQRVQQFSAKGSVDSVRLSMISNMVLPKPPKEEQEKIAEVLSTVDRAIAQTEALIAKQQRIKTGLMQDLLTKGIDENGNIRSEETHEFKDSAIGRIPVEWEVKSFFDCASISEGQRDPKQNPYRDWILIAPDHIESKTGRLISLQTALEQSAISGKYEFKPGDVIYSKIRPYLRKAILVDFRGLCSADMYALSPRSGIRSDFLLSVILGEKFSGYAESVSDRSGFPKINRSELAAYQIVLPDELEQGRISETAKQIQYKNESDHANLKKLLILKTGLMQDLLTGKVRVTPLLENSGGTDP
ncbi:restriction endonuclease subunit S [Laspinema palackyanum]|uniref:restriction endonuclease subunit S n=1 Tax=Laspinema palackyanum TaxID=3231601 RepID=UPI00345D9E59|nr:restriction endonuclease subunit S [Laspinema sp. D2c]